ncbi:MAG TPA: RluA family pseudouridine synthase [Clostridiaceae bacterium]|nr:RluA family pseudouridine synthase [Clostridiaceae bacterium]
MESDFLIYNAVQEDDNKKLYSILKSNMNLSRRMIIGLKKSGGIYINGSHAMTNAIVKKGDTVSVDIKRQETQDIAPQDIPIDVVYEDRDLLIVNKQPGIVVHPTKGHPEGTLSNGIIYHWRSNGDDSIVRLVNRLDRDTSGLMIVAKNKFSHQAMAKQLDANKVVKIYIAVVHGAFKKEEGTIDLPIDRPTHESIKREVLKSGQNAITHFKVIENYKAGSLLKIRLETGKTHQIRVHMSYIGHPLFGDTLYGVQDDSEYIKRQALHAVMLKFDHPRTGKDMCIKADLPDDIKSLIKKLGC